MENLEGNWLGRPGRSRDRFWSKVHKEKNSCWLWVGSRDRDGYGRVTIRGKGHAAHRVSYQSFHGPIEPGMVVDHLCRVTNCVNPSHLEAVSVRVNIMRGAHADRSLGVVRPMTADQHRVMMLRSRYQKGSLALSSGVWFIRFTMDDGSRPRFRVGEFSSKEDASIAADPLREQFNAPAKLPYVLPIATNGPTESMVYGGQ